MTSQSQIRQWLNEAPKDATHMLVICDTFDYGDYPKYVLAGQNVHLIAEANNGPNMTKLMEVYNLSLDHEEQLKNGTRIFNY